MRKIPVCGPVRAESPASPEPRATPWVLCPPFPTPCKGKSKSQPFAHTFALTGRRRLYADNQGVALGCRLAALSGRSRRRFELIEFLQRGCGLRRSSLVGLRRRNNESNELPGRSGAGNCPCKGLIFQDRGLPLSPASAHRFSLQPLQGAHIVGGACPAIIFEI